MKKDDRLLRVSVLRAGPTAQAAHVDSRHHGHNAELYAICDVVGDSLCRAYGRDVSVRPLEESGTYARA